MTETSLYIKVTLLLLFEKQSSEKKLSDSMKT